MNLMGRSTPTIMGESENELRNKNFDGFKQTHFKARVV